jgi:hypothetical protein
MVPALTVCALQILLLQLLAGNAPLDRRLPIYDTEDLQYDDGTANWLSWAGLYRGTWFNLDDFAPGWPGDYFAYLQYWFYHHSSYPWDTASFYAELYNGDSSAPVTQLNQTSVVALHYAPCYANFSPLIYVDQNFWALINTEMSAGGWPSILGDNTPNPVSHSFFSDDFIAWEPWVIGGSTANDFFVRAGVVVRLDETTWGAIKTLF